MSSHARLLWNRLCMWPARRHLPKVRAWVRGAAEDGSRQVLQYLREPMRISTDQALLQPSFTSISSARARPSSRSVPPSCSWSASRASTLVHAHVRSFFSSRTHLVFLVVVQQHVCHVVELGFAIHGHVMRASGAWFVGNRAAPRPLVPTPHPRRSRYDHRDLLGKDAKERSRSRRGSEANPTDRSHPRSLVGGVEGGTVERPSMDWKDRRDASRRRCRTSPACVCVCVTHHLDGLERWVHAQWTRA